MNVEPPEWRPHHTLPRHVRGLKQCVRNCNGLFVQAPSMCDIQRKIFEPDFKFIQRKRKTWCRSAVQKHLYGCSQTVIKSDLILYCGSDTTITHILRQVLVSQIFQLSQYAIRNRKERLSELPWQKVFKNGRRDTDALEYNRWKSVNLSEIAVRGMKGTKKKLKLTKFDSDSQSSFDWGRSMVKKLKMTLQQLCCSRRTSLPNGVFA